MFHRRRVTTHRQSKTGPDRQDRKVATFRSVKVYDLTERSFALFNALLLFAACVVGPTGWPAGPYRRPNVGQI